MVMMIYNRSPFALITRAASPVRGIRDTVAERRWTSK